jgi:gamma-aminobutyric acid type B receptor
MNHFGTAQNLSIKFSTREAKFSSLLLDDVVSLNGVLINILVSMALSVALLICVLAYRRNPVISHSSSLFLCYILVGTLISYSSIFVDSPSNVSVATCTLNPLLLGIGFIMTFGSLFAKVWRIWSLYNNKSLTINNITDARLTIITAVLVAIEIAITVVIAALGNDPLLSIDDPYKPSTWQMECSTSNVRTIFVIIAVVYNGAVVAVGIYLTVRIRVIPNKVYNESKLLAFIIYCIAFCGVGKWWHMYIEYTPYIKYLICSEFVSQTRFFF